MSVAYDREATFVKFRGEGFLCQFCFEDEHANSEDYQWYHSSQVLLKCNRCGETNETEEVSE